MDINKTINTINMLYTKKQLLNTITNNQIKNYLNNIKMIILNNFSLFDNKNTLFDNPFKNEWNNTFKNIVNIDNLPIWVSPQSINRHNDMTSTNLPNINNYINQAGGIDNQYQYQNLGIDMQIYKEKKSKSSKVISTSLFDKKLPSIDKNISHYSACLYQALKLYLKLIPDYDIHIYIDNTIINNQNKILLKLLNFCKSNDKIKIIKINQYITDNNQKKYLVEKNDKANHIGLLGAMFRFYTFLDPTISHAVHVDADNFPTQIFIDTIKMWEKDQINGLLIYKPLYYARKNINGDCVPNVLAGMFGFNKPIGKIINPEIIVKMFEYIDRQYSLFKAPYNDSCDNNVKKEFKTPFHFSFEEQALTNILIPIFIKNNIRPFIIPITFDFGDRFYIYYDQLLDTLTSEFNEFLNKKLHINKTNTILLCYVTPIYGYNIHIAIIFIHILYQCIKNNKTTYLNMQIFSNIQQTKNILSLFGFYAIYPSFNIALPIAEINNIVDNFMNDRQLPNNILFYNKLPEASICEFGCNNPSLLYQSVIDPDWKNKYEKLNIESVLEKGL
jgi:hypothetical protein